MPTLRWDTSSLQTGWRGLVPLVVGGVVALVVAGAVSAGASDLPPPRTAAQLVADLGRVHVAGYSGTVVQKSTLLPASSPRDGDGLSLARLMSGSNTIKVWDGGPDRQRIAVLDVTGESDVFRDGDQIWQWDSNTRVATQSIAPVGATSTVDVPVPVDGTTVTPDDLARQAVAAIGPDTTVQLGTPTTVADRSAYQLVLTPPALSATRIGRVVLFLDGATRMPLAAQVFARDDLDEPLIDLAFQHIAFEVPDESAFQFVPPPGATIQAYNSADADLATSPDPLLGMRRTTTTGSGWTRVAVITPPDLTAVGRDATTAQFGDVLEPVSGSWGSGRLLRTTHGLLSMLFLDDGRIVVGSVAPAALYAALA